jgi:hypothetical protein
MKKYFGIFVLVLVLLVTALILFYSRKTVPKAGPDKLLAQTTISVTTNVNSPVQNMGTSNQMNLENVQNEKSAIQPQERVELLRRALEGKNSPIDFYGQVIDQNSNALSGAKINVSIRHWELSENAQSRVIRLEKETDLSGRFEINGATGDAFDLGNIQKEGYELEPNTKRGFGTSGGSFENPVIFKMWSTNIHEQLITGQKSFHIEPDGRAYFINLTDGTIAESGEGDLKVWIKYPDQVVRGQTYDWLSEIAAVNGGLLEETDPYSSMFTAPTDGYTSTFQYNQQIKGGQSGSTGTHRFYVMLKNGQEYGSITIELNAPYNNQIPGLIRIQYDINPSGSRILR